MLIPSTRNLLIVGAFVAVCGVGIAGWTRNNDHPIANTAPVYSPSEPVPQPVYSTDGYYPSHVAIVRDADTIVHANAFHMATAIENTHDAIARIEAAGSDVVAIRRCDNG